MRRVVWFLLVTSCLIGVTPPAARATSSDPVVGLWPQKYTDFTAIRAASGLPISYFRGRMRDGQFDSTLVGTDAHAAATAGYSLGLNIQPKTGTGSKRTGIRYTDISAQIQAGSGTYYNKLVSFANEVLALPTYGVVPNYLQFHSEANIQAAPGVLDAQPYSGTGPEYQQCYALIHQLFQSMGVTNKIYWQVVLTRAAYQGGEGGPGAWFPSDPSLFDLVGVDAYYQPGSNQSHPQWLSPSAAFSSAFAYAQGLGKQVWIDETGADEGGPAPASATAKAAWFAALDTFLEANRTSLAGVVFSHASDGGDWYLDSVWNTNDAKARANPSYTGISWAGWLAAASALSTTTARLLTATTAGSGTGTVASAPSGIACPGDCAEDFNLGDHVTLSAVADAGSAFTAWTGDCGGTGTCDLTMGTAKDVTATFETLHTLTVLTGGDTAGSVTSDVGGVACPADSCVATGLVHGSHVVLTAAPSLGSAFSGWSGGGCSGSAPTCDVAMDQDRSVTATFTPPRDLTVTLSGNGTGTVTTPPAGIGCPGTCVHSFAVNASVTLHAVADAGSIFTGWSSNDAGFSCPGTSDCTVTMDVARTVAATFEPTWLLQVQRAGAGGGSVTSDPGAINCGGVCQDTYQDGTIVTLHADDGPNAVFASWSGDTEGNCTGAVDCVVTMDRARTITATYDAIVHQLSVTESGTGTGTITSLTPNTGIDCGATCSWDFQQGISVVLHAAPDASSDFIGWSGGGCSGTADCTVSITGAVSVDARFDMAQRLLTVTKAGNGNGSVTSDEGGIDCPGACSLTYEHGTAVVLTASPGANSVFTGWSGGACSGTITTCSLTMDGAKNVTAMFALVEHTLSVSKLGSGTGTVFSDVGAISCGVTCSDDYDHGSSVTLMASANANMIFAGWGGACGGTGTCTVMMDAARSVTATFTPIQRTLTVTKTGTGTGTATSLTPNPGIDCGATCQFDFQQGSSVVLHAAPDASSTFIGWSGGGCSGTADCTVSIDMGKSVNARFDLTPRLLTVTKTGNGNGSVTSDTGGINCPGTCAATYAHGTGVVLTANPGANSVFTGWSGGVCSGTAATCNLTMDAAKNVAATFTLLQRTLTVTKAGSGTGSITGVGINCPGTCSANFDHGTVVTLTATTGGGATFAGWSGTCSGVGTCTVTMDAAKAVTGTFNPPPTVTTLIDNDPAVTYNGWVGVADAAASSGFIRNSDVKNDEASWTSPNTTSITWVTRKGPAQGNAIVTIDGVNKGTVDLYATTAITFNKTYSGLSNKAHTIVVSIPHTKNATSTGYNVKLDSFVSGSTSRQAFDPAIQYNAWKGTAQSLATDGTYRSSAAASATVKVTFTGTAIDWITVKGKAYGKASVKIDGVSKGTVDLYRSTTAWHSLISYTGLSAGPHTIVIQVLGQKNAAATGKTVVVDGFVVHG